MSPRHLMSMFFMAVLLMGGCSSLKPTVDYQLGYDFSALKNFAVLPVESSVTENPKVSELEIKRIERSLINELSKRFTQSERAAADFLVRYVLVVEERMRVDAYNATFGLYRGGFVYSQSIHQPKTKNTYFQQGTIIVDILAPNTEEVLWRGSIDGKMKPNLSPAERQARVERHMEALFTTFPPISE